MSVQPPIQLIVNVVAHDGSHVVLTRHGTDEETVADRWWLPGEDIEPYEHPDEVAHAVVAELGLDAESVALAAVQSFRGRRGWHIAFDYNVVVSQRALAGATAASWFPIDDLPRTAHGAWEGNVIKSVLGQGELVSE